MDTIHDILALGITIGVFVVVVLWPDRKKKRGSK